MAADSVGQIGLDLVVNQNQFKQQMAGIQGLAKKAGAALAAAFAVKKIVDFGAQCIELGSDLQEVQNVVDVTFPRMSRQVDKFAKDAAASFGLSETMAKKFTGTFGAMAKAFGFPEQAAYEMSTALTGLSGDVASFYNISQDEAYTKLKSVFTGETESLKDLGVVMTQAALDQYALANGFGKTTQAMTEAEKVSLRYKFVTEQLSGASGDFLRTSDGWANQVRVLKLQFDSLKATIGQGLITALTPVIKVINTLIARLMTLANYFSVFMKALFGGGSKTENTMSNVAGALAASAGSSGATAGNLGQAAKSAEKIKKALGSTGIDELNILSPPEDTSGGGGADGGDIGGVGASAMDMETDDTFAPDIDTTKVEKAAQRIKDIFNGIKTFFAENKNAILATLGGLVAGIAAYFTAANWPNIVKAIVTAFSGIKTAIAAVLSGVSLPAAAIAAVVAVIVAGIIDLWNTSERFRDNMRQAWDLIATAFKSAWSMIWNDGLKPLGTALAELGKTLYGFYESSGLKTLFEYVVTGITWVASILGSTLITAVSAAFTVILEIITGLVKGLTWIVEKLTWLFENWSTVWTSIKEFFIEIWEAMKENVEYIVDSISSSILVAWSNAKDTTIQIWDSIKTFFTSVWETMKSIVSTITSTIKSVIVTTLGTIRSTWSSVWNAILTLLKSIWDNISSAISDKISIISTAISGFVDGMKQAFSGLIDFITGVFTGDWSKAWEGVKDIFKGIFNAVVSLLEDAMNFIVEGINRVLEGINDVVEAVGDVVGMELSVPTMKRISLPRLAQGGFVKANTPQLAVIGDNRHYGEIVAPEDKMQEMVDKAVAMASGNAGMTDQYLVVMIDLLRKIIELIENLDLTVTLDTREIKKKLSDLEKRSGYALKTT